MNTPTFPLKIFIQTMSWLSYTNYFRYSLYFQAFYYEACFVMFVLAFIRVYRVIFDLLFLMVNSTGCCFVLLKKSSFLMVSGQLILNMFLGYLFKKMWTDFLDIKCLSPGFGFISKYWDHVGCFFTLA